jgi:hypothetical protein
MPPRTDPVVLQLLIALARPELDPATAAQTRTLAGRATAADWLALAESASGQRSSAWVWHNAVLLGLEPAPAAKKALLRASRALTRSTMAADALLRRIEPLLVGPAPPAMLVKGAVVEARAYPAGLMRPQLDVDIVARPGAMPEVVAWLRERGFKDHWTTRSGHELALADPEAPSVVEVHRTILCPYRFAPFARPEVSERLFARGQRDERGRLVPGDIDHTAFLLTHLVELVYADLRHVADCATWLRRVSVDPAAVQAVGATWLATRAVAAGVLAVERFDPGALGLGWRALVSDAPDDLQALCAAATRAGVGEFLFRRLRLHPRWLEGIGLTLHLDRPARFLATYLRPPRLHKAVG